jgi:hypothetical protein
LELQMYRVVATLLVLPALWIAQPAAAGCPEKIEAEVLAALDRFLLDGFNSRDAEVWAGTLSYPHCRIGGPTTGVWRTPEEYAGAFDYQRQFDMGWDHSEWGSTEVLWCTEDAAFARVHYLRKRADDSILHSLHGIYTLTRQEDGWGVLARFSAMVPASGEVKIAAEQAAKAALTGHLAALDSGDSKAAADSLNYPYLQLKEEAATLLDSRDQVRPDAVDCGGRGLAQPLLTSAGAVILGLGFDGQAASVYAVTRQGGHWGVRGCSGFTVVE